MKPRRVLRLSAALTASELRQTRGLRVRAMNTTYRWLMTGVILACVIAGRTTGQEPVSLKTVKDPGPNQRDEPAGAFSVEKAVHFMDSAALNWQKQKNCFT